MRQLTPLSPMLRSGNLGLKMGISRVAHTHYAYMEVPPPPGHLLCYFLSGNMSSEPRMENTPVNLQNMLLLQFEVDPFEPEPPVSFHAF